MQIFARLTKVNESERTVEGVIADETPDKASEVFDYAASKPHFQAWSEGIAKATDGKNLGNVRVMHGNTVAGVTKAIEFNDDAKAITVKAHIVDDNEWKKTLAGCYTGFSIGGRYEKKWDDGDLKRYAAIPSEYSLVDLPCNPSAQFTVVKADGSEELRKFEATTDAEALTKWYAGQTDEVKDALTKIAERKDVSPKEGEHKYGDVKFADEKNKKYPIDTPAHIRAAWNYINKAKNAAKYDARDLKTIKSRIVAAWKDKIDKNGPPSASKDNAEKAEGLAVADSRAAGLLAKIDEAEPLLRTVRAAYGQATLEKGMWTVSELAQLVANLDCITLCAEDEANWEGDNSAVPGELRSIVKELAGVLMDMADEEVEELVSAYEKADLPGDLSKVAPTVENQEMNEQLQKAHDEAKAELVKMQETLIRERGELAKANESLAKVTAERDDLTKAVKERDEALIKAAAHIEAQAALIAKMQDQPEALKIALTAVAKGDDVNKPDDKSDEKVLKRDGTVDEVQTALRKALRNPVMVR